MTAGNPKPHCPENQKKRRNDLLLIAGLLCIVAIGLCCYRLGQAPGLTVVVRVENAVIASFPLAEDCQYEIRSGKDGSGRNLLVIANGAAKVTEASCPDLICAGHKPIHAVGESIICLPNRVVISIE